MIVVGFDPGQGGGIAFINHNGDLSDAIDMPVDTTVSAAGVALALREHNPLGIRSMAIIEDVHAMPGQGVSSMFKFGLGKGILLGVTAALGMETRLISPATWKRAMKLNKDKGMARRRAMELWPDKAALFQRVKDDGRAEAALIGRFWWEHLEQGRRALEEAGRRLDASPEEMEGIL